MIEGFRGGRSFYLTIRNERANAQYTADFMRRLFEEEGNGLFDVRQSILGHVQQGANPSPFDRVLATRLAAHCIDFLVTELERGSATGAYIGLVEGKVTISPLKQMLDVVDLDHRRPLEQWWLGLRPVMQAMARPAAETPDSA